MNHKLLSPKSIQPVVDKYIALVSRLLEERTNQYDGMNVPLRDFITPLAFDTASRAFFGEHCPAADLLKPFKLFDVNFDLLLAGVPKVFMKGPAAALDDMAMIIEEKYLLKPNAMDDASELIREYERITREEGFVSQSPTLGSSLRFDARQSTRDVARLVVTFLWALQTNAPLATYWLIALNLQRPGGLEPLAAEIDKATASWNVTNPSLPLNSQQNVVDFVNQADLPLLNSTIQETLRFTTSFISIRTVTEKVELGGYTLDQGDEITCSARTVHLDPEVHERPDEYIPTRYMTAKKFVKNGRPVPNHTLPFGGGVSMCEGR